MDQVAFKDVDDASVIMLTLLVYSRISGKFRNSVALYYLFIYVCVCVCESEN